MLDILIPIHPRNLHLVTGCVAGIDRCTVGIPARIILAFDGMTKKEFSKVTDFMRSRKPQIEMSHAGLPRTVVNGQPPPPPPPDWVSMDWPSCVYLQKTIQLGLREASRASTENFLAIIPPWVEVQDKKWFSKMHEPFAHERTTGMVTVAASGHEQHKIPPSRFPRRKWDKAEMALIRPGAAREIVLQMGQANTMIDWVRSYSEIAESRGFTRWSTPSVRYKLHDHHDHSCPQPGSSEEKETPSESQSQTTPSSSTQMTTETDGSGDFVPF